MELLQLLEFCDAGKKKGMNQHDGHNLDGIKGKPPAVVLSLISFLLHLSLEQQVTKSN